MPTWKLCAALLLAAACARSAEAQARCGVHHDAAAVLQARDTAVHLDAVRLAEVEAAICAARARYPELRRIGAPGDRGWLYLLLRRGDLALVERAAAAQGVRARPDTVGWHPLGRTGIAVLDSLNRRYRASRVEGHWTFGRLAWVRIAFALPANVDRLYRIYEAAGVPTGELLRGGTGRETRSSMAWRRVGRFDYLRFERASRCLDPCERFESYLVRVDRRSGRAEMVERHDAPRPPPSASRSRHPL